MKLADAIALAKTLTAKAHGRWLHAFVENRGTKLSGTKLTDAAFASEMTARYYSDARIVFEGGKDGSHSLDVSVSSTERVMAHWAGYVENNTTRPVVGQLVLFPSGSSPTGRRLGKVVKVGPKRAVIAYTFKHGGKTTKTIAFGEIFLEAWK